MRRLQFLIYFIYTPKNVTKSSRSKAHIYTKYDYGVESNRAMRSCLKFPLLGARCCATKTLKARTIFRFIYVSTHNIAKNETRIYEKSCLIICVPVFRLARIVFCFFFFLHSGTAAQELNLLCRTLY